MLGTGKFIYIRGGAHVTNGYTVWQYDCKESISIHPTDNELIQQKINDCRNRLIEMRG